MNVGGQQTSVAVQVAPGIAIPEQELDQRFIQSSGPGGQNVNKVATAVQLRFDVAGSQALPRRCGSGCCRLADRGLPPKGRW